MKKLIPAIFCLLILAGCQRDTPNNSDTDGLMGQAVDPDSNSDIGTATVENSTEYLITGIGGQEIAIPKGSQEPIEIDLKDVLPQYIASDFMSRHPELKVSLVQESVLGVQLFEYEVAITGVDDNNSSFTDQKVRLARFIKSYMDGTAAEKRSRINPESPDQARVTFESMSTIEKYDTFLSETEKSFPGFTHEWVISGGNTGVNYDGKEMLIGGIQESEIRVSVAKFILNLQREIDLANAETTGLSDEIFIREYERIDTTKRDIVLTDYIPVDISDRAYIDQLSIDAGFTDEERSEFQYMPASEKLTSFLQRMEAKHDGFDYDWVNQGGNSGVVYRGKGILLSGVDDGEERRSIAQFLVAMQKEMDLTGVRNDKFEDADFVASSGVNSAIDPSSRVVDYTGIERENDAAEIKSGFDSGFSAEERSVFQSMSAGDKLASFEDVLIKEYPDFSYEWVNKDGNSEVEYRGKEILINGIEDTELRNSVGIFIRSLQREIDLTGVQEF